MVKDTSGKKRHEPKIGSEVAYAPMGRVGGKQAVCKHCKQTIFANNYTRHWSASEDPTDRIAEGCAGLSAPFCDDAARSCSPALESCP